MNAPELASNLSEHAAPNTALLYRFLRDMVRIRLIEEAIADGYRDQQMRCPVHLSVGQEAIAVGVSAALRRDDRVVSNHRCHAHYLAKGGNLRAMMAELHGKATGCCGGRGGSMHLFDNEVGVMMSQPIVASSIPVGVGIAWGLKRAGKDAVCVVYLGDAATEEGVFHEAANFASLHRIPAVFVCENNLYSVYTHIDARQPPRPLTDAAKAHGMAVEHVDGNDVVTVYGAARRMVQRARSDQGPGFLLCDTYRWREHCGPAYDNTIGYRTEEEFLEWKERCPVDRLRRTLAHLDGCAPELESSMTGEIMNEIRDAFQHAGSSPLPQIDDPESRVYG